MAKVDAELLKKHHFWVLLIPYALLVGLAVLFIWQDVGSAATKKEEEVGKTLADLKSQQPKSETLTKGYGLQKDELEVRRTALWKAASKEQAGLFAWSKNLQAADRELLGKAKFGSSEPISNPIRSKFTEEESYMKEYSDLVNSAYPIQFGPTNAWKTVLTPVPEWRQPPEHEEMWLAMEDFWARQQMVALVNKVNRDVGRFAKVSEINGETLWRSRIWELTLKIENDKGAQLIKGKLKNISDRVQPLGVKNVMFVKLIPVDVKPEAADESAIGFPIEGELLKAGETIVVKTLKEHRITDANLPAIGQIEQVFDARTAPIKRIDRLVLGYHSSRTMTYPLKMSAFSQKIVDDKAAAATTAAGPGGAMPGVGSPPIPGGAGGYPGGAMMPGPGGDAAAGAGAAGATSNPTAYGLERNRYLDVTTQVRRMPVGLLVVADQHFIPDLLTAATNSPLRFQTTQSNVRRFDGEIDYSASGNTAYSGSTAAAVVPKDGVPPVAGMPPLGSPLGSPMPGGPGMMPSFNPFGRLGSGSGSSVGSFGTGTTASFSSDSQFSVNLVEVGLYGIVTLYEKFPTDAEVAAAAAAVTPAKK